MPIPLPPVPATDFNLPVSARRTPGFLCMGHFCHDRYANRNILGGSASYASLLARQLGLETAVLTSCGPDFEFWKTFSHPDILVCNKPAEKTTVFENIYRNGQRIQYLHARAETLYAEDLPTEWAAIPVVLGCPIAGELDFGLLQAFPASLVGVTIQGWLRQWDKQGRVSPKAMDWSQLAAARVVVLSDADIEGFESAMPLLMDVAEVVVVTQGARGALVFSQGRKQHFPAFPVQEVDATGAGDVFATAFLICFAETNDVERAALFAHAAASFVVEGVGIGHLPSPDRIQERMTRAGFT